MNGATDDPPPITIKKPSINRKKMTGTSQNFFRSRTKLNRSLTISIIQQKREPGLPALHHCTGSIPKFGFKILPI